MNITVSIALAATDDQAVLPTPTAIAHDVLAACGGDASKDMCTVNISGSATVGSMPEYAPPTQEAPSG